MRDQMVSKSLLISVDASAEAEVQDVRLQYSSEDERNVASDHDLDVFNSKIIHRKGPSKDSDEEMSADVNFNVVLNPDTLRPPNIRRHMNPIYRRHGASTAGDFVDEETASYLNSVENRERRQARLIRFGERAPSPPPQADKLAMDDLYRHLEIDPSFVTNARKCRLNAIHVRGIGNFTTENIFGYFVRYKPKFVEWINDTSCNVVWDKGSEAAAAMIGLSKPIKLIRRRRRRSSSSDESDAEKFAASPLNRSSKLDQDGDQVMELDSTESEKEPSSIVDAGSEEVVLVDTNRHIVPPTFVWRAGVNPGDSRLQFDLILMRFATVDDVKSSKSERDSKFYRKYGNPNYGGATGLISGSKKRRWWRANNGDDDRTVDDAAGSTFKHRRHDAPPLDLRARLRSASRWNEIRGATRRWSDDERDLGDLHEGELSPYSDCDEPVRNTLQTRVRKPLRMQMRADDFERKQRSRRRQNAALFGRTSSPPSRDSQSDDNADARRETVAAVAAERSDVESDNSRSEDDGGQSSVDVRERLKKYRMKITVDNDEDDKNSTDSADESYVDE